MALARQFADARALFQRYQHLALVRHCLQQARYKLDEAEDQLETLGLQAACFSTCREYLGAQCVALAAELDRIEDSLMQNLLRASGANTSRGN
eukprot:s2333_g11.t1